MVPLVGGATHAPALVPLLEALAKEEETVVRDAAVASLCKVGATFSRAQAMEHLVPCIRVCLFCSFPPDALGKHCELAALLMLVITTTRHPFQYIKCLLNFLARRVQFVQLQTLLVSGTCM